MSLAAQPARERGVFVRGARRTDFFPQTERIAPMRLRRAMTLLVAMGAGAMAGCAGERTVLTGGPTVGQLKTSLSHIEFENEQLKKSVAKLERESRSMEDRLVQEQIHNGDLAARLDDARNLLRDRGVDADVRVGSRRQADDAGGSPSDLTDSKARTVGQPARPRRKPPFAQISGQVDALPSIAPEDRPESDQPRSGDRKKKTRRPGRSFDDDLDHHSFNSSTLQWLPVADSTPGSSSLVR
jgi:hypothetical protein